jgi:hypothetical protein
MRIIRFFSDLTKFKSPKKYKTKILTLNNLNETNYKNIDINDLDYSDNFWKNSEKLQKKNLKNIKHLY